MCTMRVQLIGHFQPCMTEIYLHIVARMADYMATHPYITHRRWIASLTVTRLALICLLIGGCLKTPVHSNPPLSLLLSFEWPNTWRDWTHVAPQVHPQGRERRQRLHELAWCAAYRGGEHARSYSVCKYQSCMVLNVRAGKGCAAVPRAAGAELAAGCDQDQRQ